MQLRKFFIGLIAVFLMILTGCSKGVDNKVQIVNEEQFIKVQKLVGNKDNFEEFKKITARNQVLKVKEILKEAKWVNEISDMTHPPAYQFVFQPKDPKIKAQAILYRVWISPDKGKLEIIEGENQYAQLTKEQSAVLFEIISGEKLAK